MVRYAAFAAVATAANLAAQRAVLRLGDPAALLPAALGVGTALGLGIKYFLDQRWIFRVGARGFRAHRDRFSRYTLMGLATTAVFWGCETACWLVWRSEAMRELGAVLGLGLGYWAKYHLDRRFVFGVSAAAKDHLNPASSVVVRVITEAK